MLYGDRAEDQTENAGDSVNCNLNHVHERSEAGRGGIPLRKIEVLCSDDVADSRLRIVGLIVRLPKTSVAT